MFKLRPKIAKMTKEELAAFREAFPFAIEHHFMPNGTDENRKLAEQFFRGINSPVATSGNRIYLSTETDVALYQLGMYR